MKEKKKLKLKKFHLHPITSMILMILFVVVLSGIFSLLEVQATYSRINTSTKQLESVLITVNNLFNYDGLKYIISNAAKNFISFTPLSTLLIALIGLSVAESSGLLETFIKRHLVKLDNRIITFTLIFLATISSIINDVGYVILIPLGAILFLANNRNPLAGIIAAFSGASFGYGVTVFVGSSEVNLIPITSQAASLIDSSLMEGISHISLTSNLFIIIATSIILSLVGTLVIEKIVVPKLGRYKERPETVESTTDIQIVDIEEEEQKKLEIELNEKKGLRYAGIAALVIFFIFVYSLIPGLPFSGILLDTEQSAYVDQLFGTNSYFQEGFTFLVSLFFLVVGYAYGKGAKTFKNQREMFEKSKESLKDVGSIVVMIFFASQLISIFRQTNIGNIITAWGANIISNLSFTGIPLILLTILVIAVANLFVTTPVLKWNILAPVVVPSLMQSNITPQFAQFILRAGDSMTKGFTPLLAYFVIYIAYLNIYNKKKDTPITIKQSISWLLPYGGIMCITWILIILGWYLIGLPLGPGVFPTA